MISKGNLDAVLPAPARVVATVVRSKENPGQNLVLFDNPDLTVNYTTLLQHVVNIRQKLSIIRQITVPKGHSVISGGQYENQEKACKQLSFTIPLTIVISVVKKTSGVVKDPEE